MTLIKWIIAKRLLFKYQKEASYYRGKIEKQIGKNKLHTGKKRNSVYMDSLIDDYGKAVEKFTVQLSIVQDLSKRLFGE